MILKDQSHNGDCKVDIVIVNWNAGSQLLDCIESIKQFSNGLDLSVTVVDNCSTDYSTSFLIDQTEVELLENEGNYGFGKACNIGALNSYGEYILFLNPDAELKENSLRDTIKFMQDINHTDVGICGVKLIDASDHVARSCARFPNPLGFFCHSIGLDRLFPKLGHFMAEWSHDTTRNVDHVIGAFFFVRREVFETLEGFDERFFVYLEDLDFSYRARQVGWRSVYLADVQAFHAGGGTSNQVKAKRLFYSLRSRLLYAFKHFSLIGAMFVLMSTVLIEPFSRSALAVGHLSLKTLLETWSGYGMLFRWLPQWLIKGVTR